jgi:hypothetical protein
MGPVAGRFHVALSGGLVMLSLCVASRSACAQEPRDLVTRNEHSALAADDPQPESVPATIDAGPVTDSTAPDTGNVGDRIFGVLPNYSTVEGAKSIQPVMAPEKFHMAVQNSFDPYVFPFLGLTAGVGAGQGGVGYGRRYAMALADNSIGNFMTTAILPSALGQDPRYFTLGSGSVWHRVAYAATRSVVTRGASGARQFNLSEIGGNAIAAELSNLYYPAADRTMASTLTRWGMQVMWDTLSNELKEFWPDIRRRIRRP